MYAPAASRVNPSVGALLYALTVRPTTIEEQQLTRFLNDDDAIVQGVAHIIKDALEKHAPR
jgi:hypothetical protein